MRRNLLTNSPLLMRERMSWVALFLLAAMICFTDPTLAQESTATAVPSRRHPNIVIILLDDLGYGDLKSFNAESLIATPNINRLAKAGIRFTDAHAPGPLCHMSRYGLMTGRYPFRIDVSVWPRKPLIQPKQLTIASLAKRNGYRTHMVGKWHLGFDEQGYENRLPGGPIDCGFDSFFGLRASTDIPPYFYISGDRAVQIPSRNIPANRSDGWSPIQGAFWRAGEIAKDMELEDVTPRLTTEAVDIIHQHGKQHSQSPLFLYLALPSPHTPWLPEEALKGESRAGLYGDFVMSVDQKIGQVCTALEEESMDDNTLIILTSDNGPVWYPADVERLGHDSAGGLRGMKGDAWEAGHRMPLIVHWPKAGQGDRESDHLICFTDFLATFAELMEETPPTNLPSDSFSFLSILTGKKHNPSFPLRNDWAMQAGSVPSTMTVRRGPWKLITAPGSGGFSKPNIQPAGPNVPAGQLYNLNEDLSESTNLYQQHPEIVAELTELLEAIKRRTP